VSEESCAPQLLSEPQAACYASPFAEPGAKTIHRGAPVWIHQGKFGRATVNLISRPLVEHAHHEFNILFKLGGADAVFSNAGENLVLDDNSVLIFNPWSPHAKLANSGAPSLILSLIIEPQWMARVLASRSAPLRPLFPNARERVVPEVRLYANRLAAAISSQIASSDGVSEDLLVDLIDVVTREYADPTIEREVLATARPVDYRIRKALAYIDEHATENLRIEDIARSVGLSRSRFFEQFRNCVGASPQHYIDWARLSLATRWLGMGERPLTELAEELGFSAHSHFTRFFTQHLGVSPSEFRRQTMGTVPDGGPTNTAKVVRLRK
jgi:AraC-like DNA-binding protein